MAEAIWRYLPFVCSYARGPRRPGPRSAGKRVERVAIREDSRESARWVAEEKRDAEAWKRERKGKREKEKEEENRALYCELFERACAPGPMVLASVAAEVVPSERTTVSTRETETGEREGERGREREKKRDRKRENTQWTAGSGRRGWVSTGVSWLVWWANVCLLAASEPVNHYGPRKRLRTTFALSSISSHTLRPPRSPPRVFSPFL